ncbi:hypothetical protein DASB73_011430 [Starmerella bacillaris]|uniref:SWI/SNF and RSC complexes subunit Ssr4 C-terminal domain-containing protein n=1 Tax=Starmerella bacillaris TaxID=1247836 RepID=A0AAV5RF63_STABA|nr:hypothetical protein DASB73_011430 [Starmerella bacillaris]
MPDSAPLNVAAATVGFELDTITPRSIAGVRYVRHHEWLDHVLENPLPVYSIVPPVVGEGLSSEALDESIKRAEAEIAELKKEEEEGWKFNVNEKKAQVLSNAINRLRNEFGTGSVSEIQQEVEQALDVKIEPAQAMRPVKITYSRDALNAESKTTDADMVM